jgi:hypothetical protein
VGESPVPAGQQLRLQCIKPITSDSSAPEVPLSVNAMALPDPKLRCSKCNGVVDCTPVDLRVHTAIGRPRCYSAAMTLPPTNPAPASPTGQRRSVRAGTKVDVRRVGSDATIDPGAALVNLGADGAGVRLSAPAVLREPLDIQITLADGTTTGMIRAEVRWCRPLGGGLFTAEIEFSRRLTLNQLAGLIV